MGLAGRPRPPEYHGWTVNKANNGVIVNGNDVTAYGTFVEHYQQYEVTWNGQAGTEIFFQNETPTTLRANRPGKSAPAKSVGPPSTWPPA